MAELRSFIFIDQLQPQTMCYLASWIKGRLPRLNMAAQIIDHRLRFVFACDIIDAHRRAGVPESERDRAPDS